MEAVSQHFPRIFHANIIYTPQVFLIVVLHEMCIRDRDTCTAQFDSCPGLKYVLYCCIKRRKKLSVYSRTSCIIFNVCITKFYAFKKDNGQFKKICMVTFYTTKAKAATY